MRAERGRAGPARCPPCRRNILDILKKIEVRPPTARREGRPLEPPRPRSSACVRSTLHGSALKYMPGHPLCRRLLSLFKKRGNLGERYAADDDEACSAAPSTKQSTRSAARLFSENMFSYTQMMIVSPGEMYRVTHALQSFSGSYTAPRCTTRSMRACIKGPLSNVSI